MADSKVTLNSSSMDEEMSADNPPPMSSRASLEHVSGLGTKDTKLINRSKGVVYLVLFLSAAIVSVATYFYMEAEDSVWYHHEVCQTTCFFCKVCENSNTLDFPSPLVRRARRREGLCGRRNFGAFCRSH